MVELDNEKIRELYLATNLSQRLIVDRNKRNLSRGQMAKLCGVSTYTLGKWEKGESIPEPEKIMELFEIVDIDISDFLSLRHNAILDIRLLIQKELKEIRKRKYEIQEMLQFYEDEERDMVQILEEDCSFQLEYDDVEIEEFFEGKGNWLSPKWVYLRKGLYIFKITHNYNLDYGHTGIDILGIDGEGKESIFVDNAELNKIEPITINDNGYYIFHVKTNPNVEWKLKFTNNLLEWSEALNC